MPRKTGATRITEDQAQQAAINAGLVDASAIPRDKKVKYVKSQGQTRKHHCHWPGCTKQVPPAMWGCLKHWRLLPRYLRDKIWAAFRPGQEVNGTPSRDYVAVAREVQEWIKENYPEE